MLGVAAGQPGPFRRAISAAISLARDYVSYQNGNERCGALPIVMLCAHSLLVSFVFHTAFVPPSCYRR
jgi:hypothetical protein